MCQVAPRFSTRSSRYFVDVDTTREPLVDRRWAVASSANSRVGDQTNPFVSRSDRLAVAGAFGGDAAHSINMMTPPRSTKTSTPGTGIAPLMIEAPADLATKSDAFESVTTSGGDSTATTTRLRIAATRSTEGDIAGATHAVAARTADSAKHRGLLIAERFIPDPHLVWFQTLYSHSLCAEHPASRAAG